MSDMEDVYQDEREITRDIITVRVDGHIEARSLPAVAWNVQRFLITDQIPPIKASGRNPFRRRILLVSETSGFFFGSSQAQADGRGNCAFWPVGIPLELMHTEEIWINNPAAGNSTVSIVEEMWTR